MKNTLLYLIVWLLLLASCKTKDVLGHSTRQESCKSERVRTLPFFTWRPVWNAVFGKRMFEAGGVTKQYNTMQMLGKEAEKALKLGGFLETLLPTIMVQYELYHRNEVDSYVKRAFAQEAGDLFAKILNRPDLRFETGDSISLCKGMNRLVDEFHKRCDIDSFLIRMSKPVGLYFGYYGKPCKVDFDSIELDTFKLNASLSIVYGDFKGKSVVAALKDDDTLGHAHYLSKSKTNKEVFVSNFSLGEDAILVSNNLGFVLRFSSKEMFDGSGFLYLDEEGRVRFYYQKV